MKKRSKAFNRTQVARAVITTFCGTASLLLAQGALAQQNSQNLQRVEVTGSNIPRSESETASPVQVITSETLKNSGYTTVSEVLRDITANGQGTLSQSFNQAFAGGGSGVSLRGLTVGATLVLIDGHRMAPYPLSDDGQRAFVDISSIPFNAVERIEVLKDGASAVYGSDAIAGVVNVILKRSFKGTLATADAGTSQHGGGKTQAFSLTHGFSSDNGHQGYVALEYRKQDQILLSQRAGQPWTNFDWRSQGGENLNPGARNAFVNSPRVLTPILQVPGSSTGNPANFTFLDSRCDYASWRSTGCPFTNSWAQLQPNTRNVNLLGSFTAKINPDWDVNVKASVFDSSSQEVRYGATVPFGSFAGTTATGPGITPTIVGAIPHYTVPANYPGNTLGVPANVRALVPDLGYKRLENIDSKAYRLVGELNGSSHGWDLKSAAGYTRVDTNIDYLGYVNYDNLYTALNDPTNPFLLSGGNSQATLDFVAPKVSNKSTDTLTFLDGRASRELMPLPGGPLAIGLGASVFHKSLNAPDPLGNQLGTTNFNGAYAIGKETNAALFAEVVAPVLKTLELEAATRYDHYSTYGHSVTPKAGFKFTPTEVVAFRGTAAKGFRAPSATENGTAGSLFSFNAIRDPALCPNPGNLTSAANVPAYCNFNPTYLQGTSKSLKPEESKSYTLGMILQPTRDWSATIDYYKITVDNQIIPAASLASFDPLQYAVRGAPQTVTFGDGSTGTSSVGPIQYVNTPYVNGQQTTTDGVELDTRYRFNLQDKGKLTVGAMVTHVRHYDLTVNGQTYNLAGTHGPSIIGGNTGNPRTRAQLSFTWEGGPWTVSTVTNWISGYNVTDPSSGFNDCTSAVTGYNSQFAASGVVPSQYCHVSSFAYTNLTARYKVSEKLTLRGAINNLFDKAPPLDLQTYGGTGSNSSSNGTGSPYNPSLHQTGAIGRYFSLGLDYRF